LTLVSFVIHIPEFQAKEGKTDVLERSASGTICDGFNCDEKTKIRLYVIKVIGLSANRYFTVQWIYRFFLLCSIIGLDASIFFIMVTINHYCNSQKGRNTTIKIDTLSRDRRTRMA
jgi:hypothetical protein